MARFPAARTVPLMFRTIVIGYDTPERIAESSALAEALRDPDEGTLLLASAVSSRPLAVGGFTLAEDLGVICETTEALLAEARDALSGPDRVHIRAIPADSPARMLSELADAEHADLVIVGASRRRELGRPLPGTTAEQVLRDAPCPVAVVAPRYTGGDIRRIGVAYDGSPEADVALSAAESLARDLNAALTVYCLAESASLAAGAGSEEPWQGVGERLRQAPSAAVGTATRRYRPETQILHGVPAEEIAGRAYGVLDLLFVHRALLGSNVSGALVRAAGCPVIVS